MLTHWGWDKMVAIFQTTFSYAFSWMKMYEFRLRFHWSFVPKVPINNIPALVLIMAWLWLGDKPLSEPMMVSLLTHICVTRPQWVNPFVILFSSSSGEKLPVQGRLAWNLALLLSWADKNASVYLSAYHSAIKACLTISHHNAELAIGWGNAWAWNGDLSLPECDVLYLQGGQVPPFITVCADDCRRYLSMQGDLFLKSNENQLWQRSLMPCCDLQHLGIIASLSTLYQAMACCLTAPSHYLSQCRLLINKTPSNIPQWNSIQNSEVFIQENIFANWWPSLKLLTLLVVKPDYSGRTRSTQWLLMPWFLMCHCHQ